MYDYELVTIINPEIDAERLPGVIETVSGFISDKGGVVEEVSQWGLRRLAYPVAKFKEGNYVLTRFKLKPEEIRGLQSSLRLREEILRLLVVRTDS
jgi:small subunit ribosomal protein S6